MELFERQIQKYAIVINVNLVRATLNEAAEFREYLNEAILGTDIDLVVNLSDCQHLDSTFLGVLVSGYKKLKSKDRSLVIIEPTDQSRVFLTLNSIGKIFPLYDSVSSALADIENKKMLENIVENIEEESVETEVEIKEEAEVIHFEQSEEIITNSPVLIREELTAIEIEDSVDAIDESYENVTLVNEFEQEAEKIENLTVGAEILSEKINFESLNNAEEELHEEKTAVPEPKPLYSEINFKKGSVDWAFGFN